MTRRYGAWAGNPAGTPEDPFKCIEVVPDGYRSCQCSRKRGHGPDGLYCRQHDPVAKAAKQAAQEAAWKKKWAMADYNRALLQYNERCAALIEKLVTGGCLGPTGGSIAGLYATRPIKPDQAL